MFLYQATVDQLIEQWNHNLEVMGLNPRSAKMFSIYWNEEGEPKSEQLEQELK